ncbi:Tenascin-X [Phytophthora citrophthora]|uniref:Tenascin-X n=1 Tax=Phytophthora citrophthora TaxID=4793 RepID=A0AAD9GN62_9STRA|nr:Tenascin-X [Phytophthora citrophthora]
MNKFEELIWNFCVSIWKLEYEKDMRLLLLLALCLELVDGISLASVTPAWSDAGVTGTVNVAFTTSIDVPVGGTIMVTFPSTFYVDSTSAFSYPVGFDPSSSIAATPATGVVTITIATTDVVAGPISFTLDSISYPGLGTTASYSIRTKNAGGSILESTTASGSLFNSWSMINTATVAVASPLAGRTTSYTVSFTTDVKLRIGSVIALKVPILSSSVIVFTGATLGALDGINPASTVLRVVSPYILLTIAGQDIAAGSALQITYNNIINAAAQQTPVFYVDTRHPNGAVYQVGATTNGLTFTSTTLPSATLTPVSYWAGVTTNYDVAFANAAYLSSGSRVDITFPATFNISGTTMTRSTNLPTMNTVFSVLSVTARVTLGSMAVQPGTGRGFTLENIVNPGSTCDEYIVEYCAVGNPYTISISDSAGNPFEMLTTVAGTPIVKKPLTYGRVRPLLKTPNTLTVATVTLDTETTIPRGGFIEVVLPSSYSVGSGTITASALINIPSASTAVTSTLNSVKLLIAGTSIPANSGISFTVDKVTTPPNSAVGVFIIRTRDAGGNIIEEGNTIGGEGCTYVNDCSGHGTCTLLSKVCMCHTGWGAPTDIADYKSPDCSTRKYSTAGYRVCPSDYAWSSIPTSTTTSHDILVECSGMGKCDRTAGTCSCFPGFEGTACERTSCPNDCSDQGACMSMREMAAAKNALPISPPTTYGSDPFSNTWDADRIFGCVCDSGWAVGTARDEVQATEYFGADCSLRHCPTGNDPATTEDETNCLGKTVPGGTAVGAAGNKCLVECSNRGVCNYKNGICSCFQGYTGYACQTQDSLAN